MNKIRLSECMNHARALQDYHGIISGNSIVWQILKHSCLVFCEF